MPGNPFAEKRKIRQFSRLFELPEVQVYEAVVGGLEMIGMAAVGNGEAEMECLFRWWICQCGGAVAVIKTGPVVAIP